jgi:hypothetical protein
VSVTRCGRKHLLLVSCFCCRIPTLPILIPFPSSSHAPFCTVLYLPCTYPCCVSVFHFILHIPPDSGISREGKAAFEYTLHVNCGLVAL